MKKIILTFFILLIAHTFIQAQKYPKVYHGTGKQSKIISITNDTVIPVERNSTFCFDIINPHPVMYRYEIVEKEIETETPEQNEEISSITSSLIAVSGLGLTPETAISSGALKTAEPNLDLVFNSILPFQSPSNEGLFNFDNPDRCGQDCSARIQSIKSALEKEFNRLLEKEKNRLIELNKKERQKLEKEVMRLTNSFNQYTHSLNEFIKFLNELEDLANNSDLPESITSENKVESSEKSPGYEKTVREITLLFNDKGWRSKEDIKKAFQTLHQTNMDSFKSKKLDISYLQPYKAYNEQILKKVETLFDTYTIGKSDLEIRKCVSLESNAKEVHLKATVKDSGKGKRDTGMIFPQKITLKPYYDHPFLELAPMISFSISGDVPKFSTENGIITKTESGVGSFNIGAILLGNVKTFGKFKEQALGVGLGAAINSKNEQSILNHLNISTLYSYKDIFRIGLGIGVERVASGLKNNLNEGSPIPSDIEIDDISSLVDYKNKPAFFINFSFSGFNLPIKK